MDEHSEKAARIVFLLKKFQAGNRFSTKEIYQMLEKEFGTLSMRTIQRDLQLLLDCEPMLECNKKGRSNYWELNRSVAKPKSIIHFEENELISFHVLKAHLKAFRKTVIEEEIEQLTNKLETIAPSEVFLKESLYWDKNIGQFDYTQFDSQIRRAIKYISEKKWVEVAYDTAGHGETKRYKIMLRCIFNYAGSLYCVGYIPDYGDVALAIQHLENINVIEDYYHKVPIFDFNKWSRNRFGVFYGKLRKVQLKIDKQYTKYFINRKWHPSQKESYDQKGNYIIELRVPLGPDFISWLMSWNEAITILKPVDLIKTINLKLRNTLKNYE